MYTDVPRLSPTHTQIKNVCTNPVESPRPGNEATQCSSLAVELIFCIASN